MKRSTRRRSSAVVVAVGLALVAAACGSDNSGGSASTTSGGAGTTAGGAATSARPTKSEILIGQPADMTGFSARDTGLPSVAAGEVWAKWVNDNGGINGHPVRVIAEDTKNDPATAEAAVQDLIKQGIIASVAEADFVIESWFPLLAKAGIPSIGGECFTPSVCGGPDSSPLFFPVSTTGLALSQIDEAKRVCQGCPVRTPCLEWALEHGVAAGIWGGATDEERRAIRQRLTHRQR